MALTDDALDWKIEENIIIDKEDSDYMMPLTEHDMKQLMFALELAIIRANSEDDEEALEDFHTLLHRLQEHAVVEA